MVKSELEKSQKYGHLQFVKKNTISSEIYVLVPENHSEELLEFGEIESCQIPDQLPLTIRENSISKLFWPTKFKPNQEVEFWWNYQHHLPTSIKQKMKTLNPSISEVKATNKQQTACRCSDSIEIFTKKGDLYEIKETIENGKICTILDHKIMNTLRQFSGDYLCTNCIILLDVEPCIMCSMALLHSRVFAVIYSKRNPEFGGLGSTRMINYNEKLNHKFHVLQVIEN